MYRTTQKKNKAEDFPIIKARRQLFFDDAIETKLPKPSEEEIHQQNIDSILLMSRKELLLKALKDLDFCKFVFSEPRLQKIFGYYDREIMAQHDRSEDGRGYFMEHMNQCFNAQHLVGIISEHPELFRMFSETPELLNLLPPNFLMASEPKTLAIN